MSAFIAAKGFPQTEKIIWIVVCMVGARSAAKSAISRPIELTDMDRFAARCRVTLVVVSTVQGVVVNQMPQLVNPLVFVNP